MTDPSPISTGLQPGERGERRRSRSNGWWRRHAAGVLTLRCQHGLADETRVEADFGKGELRIDRTGSGRSDFSPAFAGTHTAPLRIVDGRLSLRLLADVSSLEVFAQDGESVLTDLVLPASTDLNFSLATTGEARGLRVDSVLLWPLKPAPPARHGPDL